MRLLAEEGVNFTQAAHAVGVSKRTGKAWRNGRARATGRNERPSVDWYRSTMDKPRKIHARYLGQEERILIADRLRPGGILHAATDHAGYAEQIAEAGDAETRLRRARPDVELPVSVRRPTTKYEGKAHEAGSVVSELIWVRRA